MLILALCATGYVAFGSFIAYALNSSFAIGGPKWLVLPAIALLWPLALLLPIFFIMSWIARGSH